MKKELFEPIFCDNQVAIFNKPHGLSTQVHDKPEKSLEFHAKAWVKKQYDKPGNVFLEPIHRIDTPVCGLVLFARTSKALSRLQLAMRENKISKRYLARVAGIPKKKEASLEHFLIHGDHRAHLVKEGTPGGKVARLNYRVVSEKEGRALLEIALETGRYHQIRIQLATIGYPIVGDSRYGSKESYLPGAIALQSAQLSFPHPVTQEVLTFNAPFPVF